MPLTGLTRDALGRHRAKAEPHHPHEDPSIVVHRGQDQGVGQTHSTQPRLQRGVVPPEYRQVIERRKAQQRLAEANCGRFGQAGEETIVKHSIQGGHRRDHRSTYSTPSAAGFPLTRLGRRRY
jgi:hypothetical protein